MRHFPTRATGSCIAAAVAATTPAAASSLQMIYQASDYTSQTNLLSPIPGAFGQVVTGGTGGAAFQGQLFVLIPGRKGSWTKTMLHTFTSATQDADGTYPTQNLVADRDGNVWGTTSVGGTNNTGTVFELVKPASKKAAWTYRYAASLPIFKTSTGGSRNLVFDNKGNLFGTSAIGCSQNDCGSLFEVTAATLAGGRAPAKVLIDLPPSVGQPPAGLTTDNKGHFFGTTYGGGTYAYGAVWEISRGAKGAPYSFQVIHSFCSMLDGFNQCIDGYFPDGGVTFSKGVLYGTTSTGGAGYTETDPASGQPQLYEPIGVTFAMTAPSQTGGTWPFSVLHNQDDYIAWHTPGPDYYVHTLQSAPVISRTGDLLIPTALGGVSGVSDFIYGAVISVNPTTGADTIVNNDFAVESGNLRSGPINDLNHPMPIHLDPHGRVFGSAPSAYDAGCACYHYWQTIYMITP